MNAQNALHPVILLGAGPGDPQLLTLAGARWLAWADAVVYDRLANPAVLAHCRPDVELVYAGKRPDHHTLRQDQIHDTLVQLARAGKRVVRLKGGDPLIFGRGGEEAQALSEAGIPFRIVPGVTAALAAGAYAGIPLTPRDLASTVTFITGHEEPGKSESTIRWDALAKLDTLVLYMGVGNAPEIARRLAEEGLAPQTPVAIVQEASRPSQRTVKTTLADLPATVASASIRPPSLLIVGQVASLAGQLAWYESLPLAGQTILVTRSRSQASALAAGLVDLGARVIEAPTSVTP